MTNVIQTGARTILVFGSQGQVATSLREAILPAGWTVRTAGRAEGDITVRSDVDRIVGTSGAAVVINAAAYTAVDRAESEPEAAIAVNRDGAGHIAQACARASGVAWTQSTPSSATLRRMKGITVAGSA